jgi:hypothetical protein
MADLVFEKCLPSHRAADIQLLFDRAGAPEFSRVYERVYQVRERTGLRSWIALVDNQVVLHISVAPEPFSDGARTLTCGLPGDLMADENHRDFWGPIKLARRMVADVRKERSADFLLTSYVPAAEGIFKAAGFRPFGSVRRLVLPLVWPYVLFRRLKRGKRLAPLAAIPFVDGREVPLSGMDSPGCFRPVARTDYFATRMPRIEFPAGTWLVSGKPESPEVVLLVSPKPNGELIIADVLWRHADPDLSGVFVAAARWAERQGYRRLSLTTIDGSRLSLPAKRAGFLLRPGDYGVMMLPICPPDTIPPPEQWSFTPFVLTSW